MTHCQILKIIKNKIEPDGENRMSMTNSGRGGKLNRSEIVHLRLNPKMRFALELMARTENRTVSSLLESLVKKALSNKVQMLPDMPRFNLPIMPRDKELKTTDLSEALSCAWDTDKMKRFIKMALYFPHLLTHEEETIWTFIRITDFYWSFYSIQKIHEKTQEEIGSSPMRIHSLEGVVWEHLEKHWPFFESGDTDKAIEDIKAVGMINKPGKLVEAPIDYPPTLLTLTDEEQFQALNRINDYLAGINKKG